MEKPILFNTEMVQAILEGRKTQTRRIIKKPYEIHEDGNKIFVTQPKQFKDEYCRFHPYEPPYQVGDTLWVRETWGSWTYDNPESNAVYYQYRADYPAGAKTYMYDETHECDLPKRHPSIHMPRAAARIFLKVTNIRVQRLQDINSHEAYCEGVSDILNPGHPLRSKTYDRGTYDKKTDDWYAGTIEAFSALWDSCYKFPKNWLGNPWVWVIEFERLEG